MMEESEQMLVSSSLSESCEGNDFDFSNESLTRVSCFLTKLPVMMTFVYGKCMLVATVALLRVNQKDKCHHDCDDDLYQ